MKVTYKRFLFIQSGILDDYQIRTCIMEGIKQVNFVCDDNDLIINVVKNKEGKHFGHTYCWIKSVELYNALIGLSLDGSERFEEIEDDSWIEPSISLDDALEGITNWAEEDEIREKYDVPYIKKQLEPLIILPGIQYTDTQKNKTNCDIGFIDIFPISLTNHDIYENYIFSKNIPEWLTENIIYKYFKRYEDEDMFKKYPKIILKKYNNTTNLKILFSPKNSWLAIFVLKVVRKIEMTDGTNKALIFFSQGKSKST